MRQASVAGGLGARCAPNGEREGQSPLAYPNWRSSPTRRATCSSPARRCSPARRAARGGRAPGTPGPGHPEGTRPLGTPIRCIHKIDIRRTCLWTERSWQWRNACFGTTEACTGALITRQASVAGGLGARCAPNGEREGRSRLAFCEHSNTSGEREGRSRLANPIFFGTKSHPRIPHTQEEQHEDTRR